MSFSRIETDGPPLGPVAIMLARSCAITAWGPGEGELTEMHVILFSTPDGPTDPNAERFALVLDSPQAVDEFIQGLLESRVKIWPGAE